MGFSAAELVQKEAPQPKQHSFRCESSPDFSVSTQLNTEKSEMQRNGEFTQAENELLAYVWLFNTVLIPLRYSL